MGMGKKKSRLRKKNGVEEMGKEFDDLVNWKEARERWTSKFDFDF